MKLNVRNWRRPVLVLSAIGLLAAVGYFLTSSQQIKNILSTGVWASNGSGQEIGHELSETNAELAHGGHGHGGEEPTVKTTLWADKIDIFLERPYAV
ncbi:MAG TPA: hypothetical protein VIH42_03325, partial [Thermoguttaceae bacterium]